MFNSFITGTKIAAYTTWILLILSIVGVLKAPYSTYAIILFSMMFTVHVLGYFFVKIKYAQLHKVTLFQSILIGYAHWLPMVVGLKSEPQTA